ncbi:hypothetical protein BVX93_01545 [bacterium B13(2017)]|nr:hypothetical protein BVX93_01545 [bacterium B13(2017)]
MKKSLFIIISLSFLFLYHVESQEVSINLLAPRTHADNFDLQLQNLENQIEDTENRMVEQDYPDALILEYHKLNREWERTLKKANRGDIRRNFKLVINAYNDSVSLERLLESIYEELETFEYGKGIEIIVVEHSSFDEEIKLNKQAVDFWDKKLKENFNRKEWSYRYVSLNEQYNMVKLINEKNKNPIEKEFLFTFKNIQEPKDLAANGFASAVNMSLLLMAMELSYLNADENLVMILDQDIEFGGIS